MSRRTGSARIAALALLAAAAAALPARALAALAVEAHVDRTELAQDEVLTLEVRVEADEAPSVSLPTRDFEFEVVSRAQSRQASFDLGGGGMKVRQVFVYQLVLAPRRAGELTIPPIEVKAGQASAATTPIAVKVLPPGSGGRGGGGGGGGGGGAPPGGMGGLGGMPGGRSSWHGWERDLQLSVELDRKEAFLGEQVTVSVWLLSPVGVVSYEGYKPPLYDGFWSEEVETPQSLAFQVRQLNGAPVRAYLLQRLALFPTRSGPIELGAFQADVVVRVGSDSPFDPFPDVRRVTRRSAPVTVQVKPLPPGAPQAFDSVNVGTVSLAASLSEKTVAAGQPVTLKLVAQGEGNVKAWSLPSLPKLPGLRAFAPTSSDKVAPKGTRIAGLRAVETVLVPEAEGTLVVPPLAWPVFDPKTGAYQVLRTAELKLEVAAPPPTAAATSVAAAPGQNALAAGLRPIRAAGELSRRADPPWRGPPFWLLLGGPVALFAGLVGWDRVREHRAAGGGARRLKDAGKVARRRLASATRLSRGAEAAPFFAEVERALTGYCADKLGRPAAGLTRDELCRALTDAGAHAPAVRALAAALDATDAGRYGGAADRGEVLALAGRAMELLEEAHWRGLGGVA
ncbi:MAG TPA: BatD family protein [Anaeromyxobacteraceae bacterium]|nr:BatD family protein [Anaeromyxobacteraceae bacterium]